MKPRLLEPGPGQLPRATGRAALSHAGGRGALTLDGAEPGEHRGAAGRAGAAAVPPPVHAGRGLHGDLVLEIWWM